MDAKKLERHLGQIDDQGFTVVENAIDAEWLSALNSSLIELEGRLGIKPAGNAFEGSNTVRIYNLLVHGPVFERVPVNPAVLPIIEGVLDEGCLISSVSSISIDPGEVAQPIHSDEQAIHMPRPHPPLVCNSMWALTDFTEENGATRIIPGSHTWDHYPELGQHYESIPAEMPKGSVLIWHGGLWHGGGANKSDARRVGIAMNYCTGFVRQQENQQLGIPLEIVKGFEPRLRELCGFSTYRNLIGHIDKQTPAQVLLGDKTDFKSIWDR